KALSRGDMQFIHSENPKILAFTRTYEDETLLVIVNLSRYTQPAEIDIEKFHGYIPVEVFSRNKFPTIKEGTPYFFTLGAHDCLWFVLEKAQHRVDHERKLPVISLSTWHDLLDTPVLETLERKVLEDYFLRMRWFGGKGRTIEDIRITDHLILNETEFSPIIFLIEVRYESGLPETYQLPVSFGSDTFQQKLLDTCPQSVIARLQIVEVDGVLYDGIYGLELQEELLMKMASHETATREDSEIVFYGNDLLSEHVRQQDRIRPRVLGGEQSNTSIIYDNKFFL